MASSKSEIVSDVLRPNYGHCFHYVAKDSSAGETINIPTPTAARDTPFSRVTCVVEDVSISVNKFAPPDGSVTGEKLVKFLCANAVRAFQHPNIHTYVLAADMSCFGVEAKQPVQTARLRDAQARATRLGVRPYVWDPDNPEPIIDLNRAIPSILALQANADGALRQALFEAMSLIPLVMSVPAGKRLILHMEPRQYTNPASLEDFMPTDASSGLVICPDRRAEVEAARAEMRDLAATLAPAAWRRAARVRTTQLGRGGCFWTIPLALETGIDGVSYEPFRLRRMQFQSGEADLAIQCYVSYLFTSFIVDRLAGERRPRSIDAFSRFYTPEQIAASTQMPERPGPLNIHVGDAGRQQVQCTAVLSTDSDFCMLLVYTLAMLVNSQRRTHPDDPDPVHIVVSNAPLLVRGTVLTRTRETLARGERRIYYPDSATKRSAVPLLLSHEIFDPGLMYADLVRAPALDQRTLMPLAVVLEDARARTARAKERRAASRARGGPAAEDDNDDDDEVIGPVIHLPAPPAGASDDALFERVASTVLFTCMLGNDYLAGLQGAARRWSYAAYAETLHRFPDEPLVRVLRVPGENDVGPKNTRLPASALPLVVHAGAHERLIGYCYYMNLVAQPGAANKPTAPPEALSIDAVARLVAQKFSLPNKQVPDAAKRDRMAMRLLWVLYYITHGTTNIRQIIDPLEFGWEGEWLQIIV